MDQGESNLTDHTVYYSVDCFLGLATAHRFSCCHVWINVQTFCQWEKTTIANQIPKERGFLFFQLKRMNWRECPDLIKF